MRKCILAKLGDNVKRSVNKNNVVTIKLKNRRILVALNNDAVVIYTKKLILAAEVAQYEKDGFKVTRNIATTCYGISKEGFNEVIGAYQFLLSRGALEIS